MEMMHGRVRNEFFRPGAKKEPTVEVIHKRRLSERPAKPEFKTQLSAAANPKFDDPRFAGINAAFKKDAPSISEKEQNESLAV